MRCCKEPIAKEANHEDDATGRFRTAPAHPCAHGTCASLHIGSRFKYQALPGEKTLAACMAYVDLNLTVQGWQTHLKHPSTPQSDNVSNKH